MSEKKMSKKLKIKISAVVLARNEEEKIGDCLRSIDWVDEIMVVDDGSVDKTVEIARKCGASIVRANREGFDYLRNLGTKKATGEWVLHVDADERATKFLEKEIRSKTQKSLRTGGSPNRRQISNFSSYAIPRRNIVFGKEIKHCGLWPDYVQRLIKKDKFVKWRGVLHETPEIKGKMGYLNNPFIHLKHDDLSSMVTKTNEWSEVEAKLMFEADHPKMNLFRFGTAIFREFWKRLVIQTAFLDGGEGTIYGLYQVWSRFISYAKLWEMQNTESHGRNARKDTE